ncbi:MAG: hypoxanthine phosphoribosyltransferase [Candidatus Lokiarchaeota archaeon]|nr:hypoxanthine phosphoribosyltransferase [Candidatus Lokiarchaeota archaeon]MBD3202182.1 hypoxanthine phosphoribosyltransferase [Candidatus Lokiarchaeota archaeon]
MKIPEDLKILIKKEQIQEKITELASLLNKDYKEKAPVLICVLKGAFMFAADLIRQLKITIEVDFIKLSSYGSNATSNGDIKKIHGLNSELEGKDVLIIEDIVDTGHTITFLLKELTEENPNSIRVCSLTSKPARREVEVKIDYLGFKIPNRFIVGYGLDFNEKFRNLADIYYLDIEIPEE